MATAGPNFPATVTGNTNTVGGGTRAWTSPGNVSAADGVFATCGFTTTNATSDDLNAQNFGFSIPSTSTINGIKVEVNYKDGVNLATEVNVKIIKGGAAGGTDHTTGAALPVAATTVSYGGTADLWGLTWTPADINASNFGVVVTYTNNANALTVSVDFIRITITYTTPAPTVSSCTPNSGPASGGTSITNLAGTGFFGTPTVAFGGTNATGVTAVSSTQITCTTPAHAGGIVNVVVTNPDAQSGTLTNGFTFSSAKSAAFFNIINRM